MPAEPELKEASTAKPEMKETVATGPELKEASTAKPEMKETVAAGPGPKEPMAAEPELKEASTAKPEMKETVAAGPGPKEPVAAEPELKEASAAKPEMKETVAAGPGPKEPMAAEPELKDASTAKPEMKETATAGPGPKEPLAAEPELKETSTAKPEMKETAVAGPGPKEPVAAKPELKDASTAKPEMKETAVAGPGPKEPVAAEPELKEATSAKPEMKVPVSAGPEPEEPGEAGSETGDAGDGPDEIVTTEGDGTPSGEAPWQGELELMRQDMDALDGYLMARAYPEGGWTDSATLLRGLENYLIDDGQLVALYWYSRANPSGGVGPWLAETLYLGTNCHYLHHDSRRRLAELFADGAERVAGMDPRQLDLLAASLIRPALTFQDHNLVKLLRELAPRPSLRPKLGQLLGEIATRNEHGEITLGEETISEAAAEAKRAEETRLLEEETRRWMETAPRQTILYALASDILHLLVSPNGELHDLVSAARDARAEAELDELAARAEDWTDPAFMQKKIQETQKLVKSSSSGVKKIVARAKGKLHERIRAAASLASEWIELNRAGLRSRRDESVRTHLLEVLKLLSEMARPPELPDPAEPEDAAGRILTRMLRELGGSYAACFGEDASGLTGGGLPGLEAALRLWLLKARGPAVEAGGEGLDFGTFVAALTNPRELIDDCLDQLRGEGHGTHLVAAAAAADPALGEARDPGTGRRLRELLADACGALAKGLASELADARDSVEEQHVAGGLSRADRDSHSAELEAVLREMEAIPELRERDGPERLASMPDALRTLAMSRAAVRRLRAVLDRVAEEASRKAEARLAELKSLWSVPEDAEALVRDMIANREYMAAMDQLGRMRLALESGERPAAAPRRRGASYAEAFYGALDGIHEAGMREDAARRPAHGPVRGAGEGLASVWRTLAAHKALSVNSKRFYTALLAELLRGLGFSFDASARILEDCRSDGRPFFWMRQVLEKVTIASVLPRWGSKAGGRHVLLLAWGNLTAGDIVQQVSSYGEDSEASVIVLCFGRLSRAGREILGRDCRRARICPVVVDSNLADWLASGMGPLERADAFLEAGAAGGWDNPYTPDAAGAVPGEMFYGRESDMDELWNRHGTCLMFGGRQLGKSAMLLQLRRRRHRPDQGDHVLYRSARYASTLDETVSSMLREADLWSADAGSGTLTEHVQKLLAQQYGKCRRILLLIDESDRLLDAERECGFARLEAYRDLMQSTGRRFKIVLSGTHSVQRFQHYPNSPLKHFGTPLRIGPLDSAEAFGLIERPMRALGIAFETTSLVYKALTLTNYHPSLIQLACHALVRHVLRNGEDAAWSPPFRITRELVDGVFRNPELQSQMRARFEWTVDLDPRYRVIAYVVAFMEEDSEGDDGREGFPATEILDNLRYFWPRGFDGVGFDQAESLMAEMEGLGLLRRVRDRFALRNEGILKLLRADGDVSAELEKFESMDYVPQSGPEGMRRVLPGLPSAAGDAAGLPSPLAYSAENSLRAWETSCALILGSEAMGLSRVVPALKTIFAVDRPDPPPGDLVETIPDDLPAKGQAEAIASLFARSANPESDRTVAVLRCTDPQKFWAVFRAAERFVARRQARGRFFKVMGVAGAGCYLKGLAGGDFAAGSESVHFLERWNRNSVANLLDGAGLAASLANGILERTGGWDSLVLRELARLRDRRAGKEPDATSDPVPPVSDGGPPADPGFRDLAGIPDPPPLYRAIDGFLVSFWDSSFTEAEFPELLGLHLESADGAGAPPPAPSEISGAFYLLRQLGLVVPPPEDQWPQGVSRGEPRYWIDRHYLASIRAAAGSDVAFRGPGSEAPEGSDGGSPEESAGGSPGGSAGGSPEGSAGGSPEGSAGGSPKGSPAGSAGGSPEGSAGGSPEGSAGGSHEGSAGGSPEDSRGGTGDGRPSSFRGDGGWAGPGGWAGNWGQSGSGAGRSGTGGPSGSGGQRGAGNGGQGGGTGNGGPSENGSQGWAGNGSQSGDCAGAPGTVGPSVCGGLGGAENGGTSGTSGRGLAWDGGTSGSIGRGWAGTGLRHPGGGPAGAQGVPGPGRDPSRPGRGGRP
ncbi:MAG: hypothetical protein LBT40_17610 [Deltaproteobacteria bacterium]|jgi:hypothetical protein|nr:hypothetical protein [Deltaproteobacteria bacterium]